MVNVPISKTDYDWALNLIDQSFQRSYKSIEYSAFITAVYNSRTSQDQRMIDQMPRNLPT